MVEQIIHQTINGKYRVVIERAASTKGVLGYKVEANGDQMDLVILDAGILKARVEDITKEVVKE